MRKEIKIYVESYIKKQTEKAVLFEDWAGEMWIPKSVVLSRVGDNFQIANWWAFKNIMDEYSIDKYLEKTGYSDLATGIKIHGNHSPLGTIQVITE